MTIDWALLLLVAAAGWMAHVAWQQLGGKLNWWILPYRERCRRPFVTEWKHGVQQMRAYDRCQNTVWRIRLSSLAPLSKVCRSCRAEDRERMNRRLGA